jgi:hypothetical protein
LVPARDQDDGRPPGAQVPDRGPRRQRAPKTRVVPQQIAGGRSTRRWSAARSTRPNGSAPTTTRSSASPRSRRTTTTPAGGRAARPST